NDYRRFTALVNEYYADPDRVMDRLEGAAALDDEPTPTPDGTLVGEP
ncbi:MAG: hypothetical protein A07HB70_00504, partial [uncultured archaeon A07HB70]